jgi:hypothetical protein
VQITQPASVSVTATSNNIIQCIGNSSTLTALGAGGYGIFTYTWNPGSLSNPAIISPTVNTTYTVIAADGNGCSITTILTQNVSFCTSITKQIDNENLSFNIYPNPNQGTITITLAQNYLSETKTFKIQILNTLGQIILDEKLNNQITTIDLHHLANGIYFVVGQQNNSLFTQKMIIAK